MWAFSNTHSDFHTEKTGFLIFFSINQRKRQGLFKSEPILEFKGSVQYVQKGHPDMVT